MSPPVVPAKLQCLVHPKNTNHSTANCKLLKLNADVGGNLLYQGACNDPHCKKSHDDGPLDLNSPTVIAAIPRAQAHQQHVDSEAAAAAVSDKPVVAAVVTPPTEDTPRVRIDTRPGLFAHASCVPPRAPANVGFVISEDCDAEK